MNSLLILAILITCSVGGLYLIFKTSWQEQLSKNKKQPKAPKKYDSSINITYTNTKHSSRKGHREFTSKAEADKAVNSLRGILEGILFDGKVTDGELNELNKWCAYHESLGHMNPFREFIHTISHRVLTEDDKLDVLEDIYWLSQQYQEDNIYYNATTADLQTLQGIFHGILADGEIEDVEVNELHDWLRNNEHLADIYPYAELYSLLTEILSDGIIDDSEKMQIKAFFKEFVVLNDKKLMRKIREDTSGISFSKFSTIDASDAITDKWVCITGDLVKGTKDTLYNRIERNGGVRKNNVSNKLNFLVIGGAGSPAWTFSSYGRKVEDALNRNKKGHSINIVKEIDFYNYLEKSGN